MRKVMYGLALLALLCVAATATPPGINCPPPEESTPTSPPPATDTLQPPVPTDTPEPTPTDAPPEWTPTSPPFWTVTPEQPMAEPTPTETIQPPGETGTPYPAPSETPRITTTPEKHGRSTPMLVETLPVTGGGPGGSLGLTAIGMVVMLGIAFLARVGRRHAA